MIPVAPPNTASIYKSLGEDSSNDKVIEHPNYHPDLMAAIYRNRHRLKRKQIKTMFENFQKKYPFLAITEKTAVDTAEFENFEIILINDEVDFFLYQNTVYFTLHGIYKYHPKSDYVIIDMGAIRFVTNGADIMAPGIVDADQEIQPGDLVWIADETHHKPLGIGEALISGVEMLQKSKGRAIKNIHYVGDSLWNLTQTPK